MMLITILFLFLAGGILGAVFDGFHTHSGTTYYPHIWIFMMAWWVPLLFGSAGVSVGLSHLHLDLHLKRKPYTGTWLQVTVGILAFGAIYFASGFLPASNLEKFVVLGLASVGLWYVFDRTWQGFLQAIPTALVGCTIEILLIHFGKFYYNNPDFLGIPAWLPFLYLSASVSVGNLARKLHTHMKKPMPFTR